MTGIKKAIHFPIHLLWISSLLLVTIAISSVKSNPIKSDKHQVATWGKERVLRSLPTHLNSRGKRFGNIIFPSNLNETLNLDSTDRFAEVQLKFYVSNLQILRSIDTARLVVTISDITAMQISPLILFGVETIFNKSGEPPSASFQYLQQTPSRTSSSGQATFNLTSIFNSLDSQLAPDFTLTLVCTLRVSCESERFNDLEVSNEEIETRTPCGPVLSPISHSSFLKLDHTKITYQEFLPNLFERLSRNISPRS